MLVSWEKKKISTVLRSKVKALVGAHFGNSLKVVAMRAGVFQE